MEKDKSLQELENLYINSMAEEKSLENKIKHHQRKISELLSELSEDVETLKDIQDINSTLKLEIAEKKREYFSHLISTEHVKKIFEKPFPIFNKFKNGVGNKTKELKEYFDGTAHNNKWLDSRYEEYKEICLKNNEVIKSKADFSKIALTLKEVDDSMHVSIFKMFNKVSQEVLDVKTSIKKTAKRSISNLLHNVSNKSNLSNTTYLENNSVNQLDKSVTKKSVLSHWIDVNDLNISSINSHSYDNYLLFVENVYGDEYINKLSYVSASLFMNTLKKHLSH